MNWENLYSNKRTGTETVTPDARSEYQRDFDRLIFCPGFRRLQNKTQVFPLPGVAFVHNRLTHSLEVSSVGRSLGKIVGEQIAHNYRLDDKSKDFYINDLQNVIAAACLAHDIGNPPFGHSGENAISKYFADNANEYLEKNGKSKKTLKEYFTGPEWCDLVNFEGNANGFRFLTHSFNNKVPGGLRLTYATLAATLKYPCESIGIDANKKHLKKYNFFQSEKKTFTDVCQVTNMELESSSPEPLRYKRHPFVYLTEAADDICYNIIDMEDAVRLGILPSHEVEKLFYDLIKCVHLRKKIYDMERVDLMRFSIKDKNDKISYLRAKCINALTLICSAQFEQYIEEIKNGIYDDDLSSYFMNHCDEMKEIKKTSREKIYNYESVVKIELTGYKILYELLAIFIPAVLKEKKEPKDEKILSLVPEQFSVETYDSSFNKAFSVLDFISGMTDTFATQLYKDLHGIHIAKHS